MKFLEWNNLIAQHFFNTGHAGKDIHLYLNNRDIINLGRGVIKDCTEEEIWNDFLSKLKSGLPGSTSYHLISDKVVHAFDEWLRGISTLVTNTRPMMCFRLPTL